jgi:hypothetical protein
LIVESGNQAGAATIMDNSAKTPARSPDGRLIDELAKSGSDLSKLHQFEFTLRFPTSVAAERADLKLIGLAFKTRIEPGKSPDERVLRGTKVMYPVESDLEGLRQKLTTIAAESRGVYEGWKAKLN